MAAGATAEQAVAAVDATGGTAIHSGTEALGIVGEAAGPDVACGGNLLAADTIPGTMVSAFLSSSGLLAERLLTAMQGAVDAGGEAGPIHSAGLKLVGSVEWPIVDLRVDWAEGCPVAELMALWRVYGPQVDDYVTRALDPAAAPGYGESGDI